MSELANLTPGQKAGCEKLIQDQNVVEAGYFQPPRVHAAVARFPGNWGGIDWSHAAFDPASGYYIVNASEIG